LVISEWRRAGHLALVAQVVGQVYRGYAALTDFLVDLGAASQRGSQVVEGGRHRA